MNRRNALRTLVLSLAAVASRAGAQRSRGVPVVGLLIGVGLLIVAKLLSDSSPMIAAIAVLGFWVLVTGGLHLDGLADSADAWVGGHGSRERTLEIMKDPRCGPMAVVVLVLVLLAKYAALVALLDAPSGTTALLVAPLLARAAMPALFYTTDYARANGLGSALADYLPRNQVPWVLIACALAVLVMDGGRGFAALGAVALAFAGLRHLMVRRLGGTTGDTAGATLEICETAALLAASL